VSSDLDYNGLLRFVPALERWFYPQQRLAYDTSILPDGEDRLCLGVLVFGGYVDRFLKYCVPSLLAPGNVRSLFQPLIIIHTDAASVDALERGVSELRKISTVEIYLIPEEVLAIVPEHSANKYWLLGAALNLHMQQAKYRAHDYHMLMPDHVYGTGFFANMMRLAKDGKKAIVQGGLSGKMEVVGPMVEEANGAIGPADLNAAVLSNLHPQLYPFVMNWRENFPISLLMILVGEQEVHIASPHMSIVYLSHELLMRMPLRLFNTTDAQLPFFIPEDVEPYVPGPDDGMVYVELSDIDKTTPWKDGCTIEQFCARFWIQCYCIRGYERFFGLTTRHRFPAGYVPQIKPMTDREIEKIKYNVRSAVSASYEVIYPALPEVYRVDPHLRAMKMNESAEAA